MDYHARWYSPETGRFQSADTAASANRYTYGLNNPMRFSDPSGHFATDLYDSLDTITRQIAIFTRGIEDDFDWHVKGNWGLEDLKKIYWVGSDIKEHVENATGGNGNDWIKKNMGGTLIARNNASAPFYVQEGRPMTFPLVTSTVPFGLSGEIYLPGGWELQDLAHELAHVWDMKSGAYGIGGGLTETMIVHFGADELNHLIPWFWNGVGLMGIPNENRWSGQEAYANKDPMDYFAEGFAKTVYPNQTRWSSGIPNGVRAWIDLHIVIGNQPDSYLQWP